MSQQTELPKRSATELAAALRSRAERLGGHDWEVPATVAMMREAADMLEAASSGVSAAPCDHAYEKQVCEQCAKCGDLARRRAFTAGYAAHPGDLGGWAFDLEGSAAGDREPDAWAAWQHNENRSPDGDGQLTGVWVSDEDGRRVRVVCVERGKVGYRNESTTRLSYANLPNFLAMFRQVAESEPADSHSSRLSEAPQQLEGDPTAEIRSIAERLETYYAFTCEGGPLKNCAEWQRLRQLAEGAYVIGCAVDADDAIDALIAEAKVGATTRLSEAVTPYLQHKDHCLLTRDGFLWALADMSRETTIERKCTCGLEDVLTLLTDAAKETT